MNAEMEVLATQQVILAFVLLIGLAKSVLIVSIMFIIDLVLKI